MKIEDIARGQRLVGVDVSIHVETYVAVSWRTKMPDHRYGGSAG